MRLRGPHRTDPLVIAAGVIALSGAAAVVVVRTQAPGQAITRNPDANGVPTTPITAQYINSQGEAHLLYPGATILRTNVHPEGPTVKSIDGAADDRAYVETFMATPDSDTQVRNWYKTQAATRDYTCIAGVGADYMYQFDVYLKGTRQILVVGYIKPEQLRLTFGRPVPVDRTIFETDYIINPAANAVQHPVTPDVCYRPFPSRSPSAAR